MWINSILHHLLCTAKCVKHTFCWKWPYFSWGLYSSVVAYVSTEIVVNESLTTTIVALQTQALTWSYITNRKSCFIVQAPSKTDNSSVLINNNHCDDNCFQKRVCLETEFLSAECPMETSHTFTLSTQQPEQQARAVRQTQQNNTYTLTHCSEWHTPELCHMFIFVSFSMETDFCHINIILVCVHTDWCNPVPTISALLPPLSRRRTSKWVCVKSQRVINVAPLDGHMTTATVSDCKHV